MANVRQRARVYEAWGFAGTGTRGLGISALFAGLLHVRVGGLLNPVHLLASVLGAAIVIVFARTLARPSLTGASRPRLGRTY